MVKSCSPAWGNYCLSEQCLRAHPVVNVAKSHFANDFAAACSCCSYNIITDVVLDTTVIATEQSPRCDVITESCVVPETS